MTRTKMLDRVGFKASDGTITVHTRSCNTANNLAAKFGDKIVTVKWVADANSEISYLARISLKGTDRIGMQRKSCLWQGKYQWDDL